MINNLYITSRTNEKKQDQRNFIFSYVFYYITYDLLERKKQQDVDLEDLLLELSDLKKEAENLKLPLARNLINETPIEFYKNSQGINMVRSKLII